MSLPTNASSNSTAPSPAKLTWAILAGGKGSRMNHQDKGLIEFESKPMIEHVVTLLGDRLGFISANRSVDRYMHYAPVVQDCLDGFLGPLAGMHAVLSQTSSDWVGFIACDMPRVTKGALQRLEAAVTELDAVTHQPVQAVFAFDGQYNHPTLCILKHNVASEIALFLGKGERKLGYFLRTLPHRRVFIDNPSQFANVNAPEDVRRLSE